MSQNLRACARCGGSRPAGLRRVIRIVGGRGAQSAPICEKCLPYCPQVAAGRGPIAERACLLKSGHHLRCINKRRQQWRRGKRSISIQGELPLT